MMGKLFSVPILGAVAHSEATREILAPYVVKREQTKFIRKAIIKCAIANKFDRSLAQERPDYVSSKIWQAINYRQQLGYRIKEEYRIDYTYVAAFYYLLSLPEFQEKNKSQLMREIIENTNHHQ